MKKVFMLLFALVIVLCACSGKETGEETSKEVSREISGEISTDGFEASEQATQTAVIYYSENGESVFKNKSVSFNGSPENLVELLVENGALPQGSALNSFRTEGKMGWIDMNQSYNAGVQSGTYAEWAYIGALVNSFIKTFDMENVYVTIDGEVLSTGHFGAFEGPIGFYENIE